MGSFGVFCLRESGPAPRRIEGGFSPVAGQALRGAKRVRFVACKWLVCQGLDREMGSFGIFCLRVRPRIEAGFRPRDGGAYSVFKDRRPGIQAG
jgi:hypothetical protein